MQTSLPSIDPRRRTEDLLCRMGAYAPARNAYQRLFNQDYYASRRRTRAFFSQFVPVGALVFDVGANEGRLTEAFAELGARVVAVEPNPVLAERVRARYGSPRVAVEAVALGAREGRLPLRLGRDGGHSTLSPRWQATAADVDGAPRWEHFVVVGVSTLDALIRRHGRPAFVKIDVEGYESEVLAGLSRPLPALSFEYLCAALDVARACVERLTTLAAYEFALARGEDHDLPDGPWLDPAGILRALEEAARARPQGYGDVYARAKRL